MPADRTRLWAARCGSFSILRDMGGPLCCAPAWSNPRTRLGSSTVSGLAEGSAPSVRLPAVPAGPPCASPPPRAVPRAAECGGSPGAGAPWRSPARMSGLPCVRAAASWAPHSSSVPSSSGYGEDGGPWCVALGLSENMQTDRENLAVGGRKCLAAGWERSEPLAAFPCVVLGLPSPTVPQAETQGRAARINASTRAWGRADVSTGDDSPC